MKMFACTHQKWLSLAYEQILDNNTLKQNCLLNNNTNLHQNITTHCDTNKNIKKMTSIHIVYGTSVTEWYMQYFYNNKKPVQAVCVICLLAFMSKDLIVQQRNFKNT